MTEEDSDSDGGDGRELDSMQPKSDQRLLGGLTQFKSDLFKVRKFHHVEFWCGDASNTWRRFSWGLGMNLVAKSDQSTGNQTYCSYVVQSNDLVFSFTAPYSQQIDQSNTRPPHPGFCPDDAKAFFDKHGLAVRAVGVLVDDAESAFRLAVEHGAVGILEPQVLTDESTDGKTKLAELKLYGDVVLRLVSNHGFYGPYLPNFEPVESLPISYGLKRLDHAVGNVSDLLLAAGYLQKFTGFDEVKEFVSDAIDTVESGLKSLFLANENGRVVLQLNEPILDNNKKGESLIQTFLDHNEGPGVQHLALACEDIFSTVDEMQMHSHTGGFEFMPGPPPSYYKNLQKRVRGTLTDKQCKQCEELGLLVCVDEHGVVLRAFTKFLGDRPTMFIELLQRVVGRRQSAPGQLVPGIRRVNCSKLFEAMMEKEKTLNGAKTAH